MIGLTGHTLEFSPWRSSLYMLHFADPQQTVTSWRPQSVRPSPLPLHCSSPAWQVTELVPQQVILSFLLSYLGCLAHVRWVSFSSSCAGGPPPGIFLMHLSHPASLVLPAHISLAWKQASGPSPSLPQPFSHFTLSCSPNCLIFPSSNLVPASSL